MAYYKGVLERFIEAAERTGDIALRYTFQKEEMKRNLLEGQERERLIEDTAERVLSRISATVDATEVFNKIDDLENHINALGK